MDIKIKNISENVTGSIDINLDGLGDEIRKGIYGDHSDQDVNIDHPLMESAKGLYRIADAIDNLAAAIREINDSR